MNIKPWRPWWADLDEVFEEDFPMARVSRGSKKGMFAPEADVYETEKEVVVELSLPGIESDKIEVSVEDDNLVVKGSTEKKEEVEKKGYYRKEISSGSFYRSIALPVPVKEDVTRAEYKKGVLKITMPKKEEEKKARKIEIDVQD